MMKTIETICVSLACSLLMSTSVEAQRAKSPERNLNFKIYTWFDVSKLAKDQKGVGEKLYYKKANEFQPVQMRRSEVSPGYKTKIENSQLTLYKQLVDKDGEVTYLPAVKGKIPSSATDIFSFLFPNPKPYLYNIDTSKSKFPMSSFLFINRQNRDVLVKINGQQKRVKPLSQQLFTYQLDKKLLLRIDVVDPNKKGASSLVGQSVGGKKDQRIIGFFYASKNKANRLFLQREIDDQSIKIPTP